MVTQTKIRSLDDFLALFPEKPRQRIKEGWNVICPTHADHDPSLSVTLKDDKILLNCKTGCTNENIVRTLGLRMADLFLDHSQAPDKKIVATYPYHNAEGKVIYEVVRFEPKGFSQRRPDGKGGYVWDLKGVTPVLYHLPDILTAVKSGDTIYIPEGEKDCDRLWELGLVATTNPMGAGKWRDEYSEVLKEANIVVIPDNDEPGREHANKVAQSLYAKVKSLKVVELRGGRDISDWMDKGHTIAELETLVENTPSNLSQECPTPLPKHNQPNYQPEGEVIFWQLDNGIRFIASDIHQERTGIHARLEIHANGSALSWGICNIEKHEERTRLANAAHIQIGEPLDYPREQLRSDLNNFCLNLWESYLSGFMPEMLIGSEDNQPLRFLLKPFVLEGGGTILFSPPGRGKSYTALIWAVSIDAGISRCWQTIQTPVLFINLERSKQSVRRRLATVNKILGLAPKRPLFILNARGKSLTDVLPVCRRAIKEKGIRLVILDSISRSGFGDLTENRPVNAIIDALSGLCDTWLALAHTPRANDEHIYGGIHFEAGADITVQLLSQQEDDGTLGVGFQSNKQNDMPPIPLSIYALTFNDFGLTDFRKAKPFEFASIEGRQRKSTDALIKDFILDQETSEATATEVAEALGMNRGHLSHLLSSSDKFVQTRKEGRQVYYGVKIDAI